MKQFYFAIFIIISISTANAQYDSVFHAANFKKKSFGPSRSKHYQPDPWEKSLYNKSEKAIFPTDIKARQETYANKLIHLIGIVQEVLITPNGDSSKVVVLLENKYWDYIEDYGAQDEVMFVSPKGGGQFRIIINAIKLTAAEIELLNKFPEEKKLMLCYGNVDAGVNETPSLVARGLKVVSYAKYTTNVFSYEIKRDAQGNVELTKSGEVALDNFTVIRYARRGQNK